MPKPKSKADALLEFGQALTPEGVKRGAVSKPITYVSRRIAFSNEDDREVTRIASYLQDKGFPRLTTAKIVRLALRSAFRDMDDEALMQVYEGVLAQDQRHRK